MTTQHSPARVLDRAGIFFALSAYGAWGFFPIYFKAIKAVPPLEVLAHRIVWSLALLVVWMYFRGTWDSTLVALRSWKTLGTLVATACLIAVNWYLYIWAIMNGHVLDASLGYYINPLVNVLFGFVFFRERLRLLEWTSVGLAAIGVAYQIVRLGHLPIVALALATTFGSYGLLRKFVKVEGVAGLTVETLVLFPVAFGYLVVLGQTGKLAFTNISLSTDILLGLSGILTALPLVWFANAVRRLPLAIVGFFQYIAPTIQLLLGVFAYGERFTSDHAVTFAFIWTALAIFSFITWRSLRERQAVVAAV